MSKERKCISCDGIRLHIQRIDVLHAEGDDYKVRRYTFRNLERDGGKAIAKLPGGEESSTLFRGGGFEVTYKCECGFWWTECTRFHKGRIYVTTDMVDRSRAD